MISHPNPRPWFTTEGDLNNATVCLCAVLCCRCGRSEMSILRGWSSIPHRSRLNATPRDLHNLARLGASTGWTKRHNSIMSSRSSLFFSRLSSGKYRGAIIVDFCASMTPRPCKRSRREHDRSMAVAEAALAIADLGKCVTLHEGPGYTITMP
jgi:hypothetical protein